LNQDEFNPILFLFFLQRLHHFQLISARLCMTSSILRILTISLREPRRNQPRFLPVQHFKLKTHRVIHSIGIKQRHIHGHIVRCHNGEFIDLSATFDDSYPDDRIHKGDLNMPSRLVNVDKFSTPQV